MSTFGAIVGIIVGSALGVDPVAGRARHGDRPHRLLGADDHHRILVGAVVAGFVAALYPSYKASNMNVLRAIASE